MNTPQHHLPILRPGRRALALLLGLVLAGGAAAQWQWRDANGSRVFSDTAPPPSVPESRILKRPPGVSAPPAAAAPAVATASAPATGAPAAAPAPAAGKAPASKPSELDSKVKQEEDQKRQADEQRVAKAKADNCQRARQAKATLDSGQRIARTNAQGEREILDEKGLAEEARRTQKAIADNCG